MSVKGIRQLRHLKLYFCDWGGSSLGVRKTLGDMSLVDYIEENKHVSLKIFMKRNKHPYLSATFINGFVKDIPLKSKTIEEVMHEFHRVNNQCKPIKFPLSLSGQKSHSPQQQKSFERSQVHPGQMARDSLEHFPQPRDGNQKENPYSRA